MFFFPEIVGLKKGDYWDHGGLRKAHFVGETWHCFLFCPLIFGFDGWWNENGCVLIRHDV